MERETHQSITAWSNTTFGTQPLPAVGLKLHAEVVELMVALEKGDTLDIKFELADIQIVLSQLIERIHRFSEDSRPNECHWKYVTTKMHTNRSRVWEEQPDGTFQHRPKYQEGDR